MYFKIIRSCLLFSFFLLAIQGFSQDILFFKTLDSGSLAKRVDSTTGFRFNIKFNHDMLLAENNNEFRISLPTGFNSVKDAVIRKTKQEQTPNQFAWYGEIKNEPGSFVLLTLVGKIVTGQIRTQDHKLYRINYIGNNLHEIIEIRHRFFKEDKILPYYEHDPERAIMLRRIQESCCDTTIDVMIIYTKTSRIAAGGNDTNAILSEIYHCVNLTNESFLKSGIYLKLSLVHTAEEDYSETTNVVTDWKRLKDKTDGILDDIHTLRDNHAADLVGLFIETAYVYEGIAEPMDPVSAAFEDSAFFVVERFPASSNYVFPHEIGHLMGARHDCNADPINTPFPYGHGHTTSIFRTIMSVATGVPRIEYWSNPNITYTSGSISRATGTNSGSCQAFDAQTLNNTKNIVSKFRCTQNCETKIAQKFPWWVYLIFATITLLLLYILFRKKDSDK